MPIGVDEGEEHDAQMGEIGAGAAAEAKLNPLGPGQHVRAPQPGAQEHHQKNLIEHRPQERQPDALEPVGEEPVDHQHRARDVEHARGIGDAEQIPGQRLAAEEVRIEILGAALGDPEADEDRRHEIGDQNGDINGRTDMTTAVRSQTE